MKRIIIAALLTCIAAGLKAQQVTPLPAPDKSVSMTLFDALAQRHSVRSFDSGRAIDQKTLSQLLWAATGVNRADGRMTAPTAMNAQDISVYVATKDGVSLYLPRENALRQVTQKDVRADISGRQTSVADAPVILLLVSDGGKFGNRPGFGTVDAAFVSQNINLAAPALGLATVTRASMDTEALKRELKLADSQTPVLNNPVGYPKSEAK